MNKSNFMHALLAMMLQLLVVLASGGWWTGAMLGIGFYLGREHAQYEVRKQRGEASWNTDAILDFVFPLAATTALAIAGTAMGIAPHVIG